MGIDTMMFMTRKTFESLRNHSIITVAHHCCMCYKCTDHRTADSNWSHNFARCKFCFFIKEADIHDRSKTSAGR